MPWKTGEERLRITRWTRSSFPSEERKIASASGASKSYGAMSEGVGGASVQTVADVTYAAGPRCKLMHADNEVSLPTQKYALFSAGTTGVVF